MKEGSLLWCLCLCEKLRTSEEIGAREESDCCFILCYNSKD